MTHRPFAPPPPPDVPAVARLQVQRATRGVRERVRWFAAFTVTLGALSGWAWLWGFALAPNLQALLCLALPGFGAGGLGLIYFGLPLVDEVTRWWLFVASARQEIALRADSVNTGLNAVDDHARRWYRAPAAATRYVAVKTPGDSKARVSSPPENPPERTTQALPALPAPTPPTPYYGTDAYALCDAALTGAPTGVNTLGRRLGRNGKARHAAALARLLAAEVWVPAEGKGSGPALAPRFAGLAGDPVLAHSEIARWLGAPPLPGERDAGKRGV